MRIVGSLRGGVEGGLGVEEVESEWVGVKKEGLGWEGEEGGWEVGKVEEGGE